MNPLIWIFIIDPWYYKDGVVNSSFQKGFSNLLHTLIQDPYLLEWLVITIPARKRYSPPIIPLMDLCEAIDIIKNDTIFENDLDTKYSEFINIFDTLEMAVNYLDSAVPVYLRKNNKECASINMVVFTEFVNFSGVFNKYRLMNIFRGVFVDILSDKGAEFYYVDELNIIDSLSENNKRLFSKILSSSLPLINNVIANRIYNVC